MKSNYDATDAALDRALFTLREVTHKLRQGVIKAEFEKEYARKSVSPGVSVRCYVEQLRISGSLDETESTMRLRQKTVSTPSRDI